MQEVRDDEAMPISVGALARQIVAGLKWPTKEMREGGPDRSPGQGERGNWASRAFGGDAQGGPLDGRLAASEYGMGSAELSVSDTASNRSEPARVPAVLQSSAWTRSL